MAEIFQMIIEDAQSAYWQLLVISRFPPFYIEDYRFMAEIAAHNWREQVHYGRQKARAKRELLNNINSGHTARRRKEGVSGVAVMM